MSGPTEIFAIVDFPVPLTAAKEALGASYKVVLGGRAGTFQLPYPAKIDRSRKLESILHVPLLPPTKAKKWKRGEELIFWGRPISYPDEVSHVHRALMMFPLDRKEPTTIGDDVYRSFETWITLFGDYVEIFTGQNLTVEGGTGRASHRLELLQWVGGGKSDRAHSDEVMEPHRINVSTGDVSLKRKQFHRICKLCSDLRKPRLEYRIMLEAYRAKRRGDNRKAIIESATAAEICLTRKIDGELKRKKIGFGNKLLDKFRMLGGRIELAHILDIGLPNRDYKTRLLEPRNAVSHKAHFPDELAASEVLSLVEEILTTFSPDVAEPK